MKIRRRSWAHMLGSLAVCWLAALPLAAAEKSPQKIFGEVKPDQALVYVIREGSILGANRTQFVYADQQFLGTLRSNSYTFSYLPPGPYLLWVNWPMVEPPLSRVELEAGKVYYFNIGKSFEPLDDVTGPAFLKGIKWYVTPEDDEREEAKEQIEEDYAKATAAAAKKPKDAPQVADLSRRQKHVAEWPQIDLKPYPILCIEDFVMADPKASSRMQGYLVETAPVRLAKLVITDLGPGVFEDVRQSPACDATAGVAVLRARIMEYKPGSATVRVLFGLGTGSARIKVHFTLAGSGHGVGLWAAAAESTIWRRTSRTRWRVT
jgi:hypothetical protein